jgi:hypothetical protein
MISIVCVHNNLDRARRFVDCFSPTGDLRRVSGVGMSEELCRSCEQGAVRRMRNTAL